jgi:hypothetical protein
MRSEKYTVSGIRYQIAITGQPGDLRAEWTCENCGKQDCYGAPCATTEDAIHCAMLDIVTRHSMKHRPPKKRDRR